MKVRKLSYEVIETAFLDLWWIEFPELYNQLWQEDVSGEEMISDFLLTHPTQYHLVSKKLDRILAKKGYVSP